MRLTFLTLSLLSTTLVACGGDDPPTPSEVRAALSQNLGPVMHEGQAASDATATLPTGSAFGFATQSLGDSATARMLAPIAKSIADRVMPAQRPDRIGFTENADGTIDTDAIVDQLNQELFTDENYLGNGVYRVPASMVCKTTTIDETTGTETETIDPDCADNLAQIQLRVRVEHESSGLRFFIQVDAHHDEPLSIYLAHDELAVSLNLDDATDAMIALAAIEGKQAPNADMKGEITGSVHILGTAHARLALSFDRALSVKFADQGLGLDDDHAWRFTSAAGEIVGVELDANAPAGKLDVGLGETTAHIPGDPIDPTALSKDIDLGGATVNASFDGSSLSLNNISLGTKTTTVSVGGAVATTIDLNPNDGRKLDATISIDPTTSDETVAVSPRYDLRHTVDHTVLGDTPPVYDITHVLFDGSLLGSSLDSHVEVLTGSLSIETNPASYGFSATAGQCVTSTDAYDSTTYDYYTQYSVGACQ